MTDEFHDMAEPRHESLDTAAQGCIEGDDRTDADRKGNAQDDAASRTEEEVGISQTGDSSLEEVGEYTDAAPDDPADLLAVSMWSAPLPHPADFKEYPEFVQRELIEIRKTEVMRHQDRQDEIVRAAIERDKEESQRQDALVASETRQAPVAQIGALVLNGVLVLTMTGSVVLGRTDALPPLVTALLGVNAMGLFVSLRGATKKNAQDPKKSAEKDNE